MKWEMKKKHVDEDDSKMSNQSPILPWNYKVYNTRVDELAITILFVIRYKLFSLSVSIYVKSLAAVRNYCNFLTCYCFKECLHY